MDHLDHLDLTKNDAASDRSNMQGSTLDRDPRNLDHSQEIYRIYSRRFYRRDVLCHLPAVLCPRSQEIYRIYSVLRPVAQYPEIYRIYSGLAGPECLPSRPGAIRRAVCRLDSRNRPLVIYCRFFWLLR